MQMELDLHVAGANGSRIEHVEQICRSAQSWCHDLAWPFVHFLSAKLSALFPATYSTCGRLSPSALFINNGHLRPSLLPEYALSRIKSRE